jgi:hypothetical protein
MPTLYVADLVERETPWPEIWQQMYDGLLPKARQILSILSYYFHRDLPLPASGVPLSAEEHEELSQIASILSTAAVECERMPDGLQIASFKKIANAKIRGINDLVARAPAAVQWALAGSYQRDQEPAGTFALDILGADRIRWNHIIGEPAPERLKSAAELARARNQSRRSRGRRHHRAYGPLAVSLGDCFRGSGKPTTRRHEKGRAGAVSEAIYTGKGREFYDFLEMVLIPLSEFLRERNLPPLTIESLVRLASKPARKRGYSDWRKAPWE